MKDNNTSRRDEFKKLRYEVLQEYEDKKITCLEYGTLMERIEECEKDGCDIDTVSHESILL